MSLWKSLSKLDGGLVQQGEGSFQKGAEGNVCSWTHPVESALFLQDYNFALESDADDINTLSSWPAVPPTPATPQVYPHLGMVTAVPV